MKKKIIYQMNSLYRDDFRVTGFEFGSGEKSMCVVGNTRGNELQQIYTCGKLVKKLKELEEQGRIREGHSILVIPTVNPYSMNCRKRFWPTDNTDINRMFPGYDLGETTQRIAGGVFDVIKDYKYGVQFTSFYMPGRFTPHIRMMETEFTDVEMAKEYGMPYVVLRKVRPYDTATLNYNWQVWETNAVSIYTTATAEIDENSAEQAIESILRFLNKRNIVDYEAEERYESTVIVDKELVSIRTKTAGIYERKMFIGEKVQKGQVIAHIIDPLEGNVKEELKAPVDGHIFFQHNEPLTYADTAVIKLVVE